MARLTTIDPNTAQGKAKELLGAVKAKLGLTPNMMKTMAHAPSVLEGYLNFSGSLGHGELSGKLREQIAIVVAETNDCSYCLAAHTVIGKMVGLTPVELASSRRGDSADAKTTAALRFAQRVVVTNGSVSDEDFRAIRAAGYSDGQIAEIIANVALNIFTNIFNKSLDVEVDFPKVQQPVGASA